MRVVLRLANSKANGKDLCALPFSAKNEVPRVARVSLVPLAACKLRSSALCTVLCFAPFKARSAKCGFRLLLNVGSAIIRLVFGRGDWRRLPPVESAGNDIVWELMGIA